MKHLIVCLALVLTVGLMSGCVVTSSTDLAKAAKDSGLTNITTGDGTFENYVATGHYRHAEIGLALGLPGIGKFVEVVGKKTNEEQMTEIGISAKQGGANAIINAEAPRSRYIGFPLFFFGLYVDNAEGTGIKVK
jgi:hypothetical protein